MKRLVILVVAGVVGAGVGLLLARRGPTQQPQQVAQQGGGMEDMEQVQGSRPVDELSFLEQKGQASEGFSQDLKTDVGELAEALKPELSKHDGYKAFAACTPTTIECERELAKAFEQILREPLNEQLRKGIAPSFNAIQANKEKYLKVVDEVVTSSNDPLNRIVVVKLGELASYGGGMALPNVLLESLTAFTEPEIKLALSDRFELPKTAPAAFVTSLVNVAREPRRSIETRSLAFLALSRLGKVDELAKVMNDLFAARDFDEAFLDNDDLGRALSGCGLRCVQSFERLARRGDDKALRMLMTSVYQIHDLKERKEVTAVVSRVKADDKDFQARLEGKGTPFAIPPDRQ